MDRWSQIVRSQGALMIHAHHSVDVPPLNQSLPNDLARPGLRMYVTPIGGLPATPIVDVTSSAVIAMLEGWLVSGAHVGKRLDWQTKGFGRRRRDTLHIRPLDSLSPRRK